MTDSHQPASSEELTWPHPAQAQTGPHAQWPGNRPESGGTALRLDYPRHRLDPRALTKWRIEEWIGAIVTILIAIAIAVFLVRVLDRAAWWPSLIVALVIVGFSAWAIVSPQIRYQRWRYEIHEDEVDLQHGVITVSRQLIPMSRIQHVDTRRGPLQRRFGLATVVFYTAAGAMEIPELADDVAADVRNRIADLAKVHDDV